MLPTLATCSSQPDGHPAGAVGLTANVTSPPPRRRMGVKRRASRRDLGGATGARLARSYHATFNTQTWQSGGRCTHLARERPDRRNRLLLRDREKVLAASLPRAARRKPLPRGRADAVTPRASRRCSGWRDHAKAPLPADGAFCCQVLGIHERRRPRIARGVSAPTGPKRRRTRRSPAGRRALRRRLLVT